MSSSTPRVIEKSDPTQLAIQWADGQRSVFSAADLRRRCPCAACVHELTGVRMLDPRSVADDLKTRAVHLVGNYALAIQFDDGHQTGIYTFVNLRALDQSGG